LRPVDSTAVAAAAEGSMESVATAAVEAAARAEAAAIAAAAAPGRPTAGPPADRMDCTWVCYRTAAVARVDCCRCRRCSPEWAAEEEEAGCKLAAVDGLLSR
jgi:hypothetical protein